jgi:hypothetical protein
MKMKFCFCLWTLSLAGSLTNAQEIGANFNHNPEIIDFVYLKKTPVEWVRTTPYIFEYIFGNQSPSTDIGLGKLVDAKKQGYKVAFGFRWDFAKHGLRIPAPGSEEERLYFATATKVLERVGRYIDVFKLGNEPNLETSKEDMLVNHLGAIPLVQFTERLLTEVVNPFYQSNKDIARPDVYVGSLPRLFMKDVQKIPGVVGLIKLAQDRDDIKGLSVHLHISDSLEMKEAFRYTRTLLPTKPIIIPEFSLFRLYNTHVADSLGDSEMGLAFCKKYNYEPSMKLYQWYSKANTERVDAKEWNDMFASRYWFPQHFLKTYYRYFQKYGVVLATYGFLSQSAPQVMGPKSPTWFINPIFPMKSLKPQADGSYTANPLWYSDYNDIVNQGKKWKAMQSKKQERGK